MFRRLLKTFDPQMGLGVLVVIVTTLVFQFVVGSMATERLAESEIKLKQAGAAVQSLEKSLTVLRDSGATNADELKGRLNQIGAILPRKLDDVQVTSIFVALAEESGVNLTQFEPTPLENRAPGSSEVVKILDIAGLEGTQYSFTVTGTVDAVAYFVDGSFRTDRIFATITKANLTISGDGAVASIQGDMVLWTDSTIETVDSTEEVDAGADTPTSSTQVANSIPSASGSIPVTPTIPAQEVPVTTLPAPSVTVPTQEVPVTTLPAPSTTLPAPSTTVP